MGFGNSNVVDALTPMDGDRRVDDRAGQTREQVPAVNVVIGE